MSNGGQKYAIAVRSWEKNWEELATFFLFRAEIRRLIYNTNTVEGYNHQLRKVIKTKGSFPTSKAARKLLYLATRDIVRKWSKPIAHWPRILNQLAIRFEERFPIRIFPLKPKRKPASMQGRALPPCVELWIMVIIS